MDRLLSNILLALVLLLGACQGDARKPSEFLCPSCVPSAGGQTGDFDGDRDVCPDLPPLPVPDEAAEALELSSVLALSAQTFELPLRMERRLATSGLVYEPVPKSETSATVMLTLGTPGLHLSEDCNMVTIPLVLAVESASGALHVELSGRVYRRAQQGEWRAYASADLAGLRGKLDFGIETGRVFIGKLFTEFGLCADILHGHFSVDGFYYADRESADAWARNDLTGISARGRSRTPYGDDAPARRAAFAWPDEGCFVSSE